MNLVLFFMRAGIINMNQEDRINTKYSVAIPEFVDHDKLTKQLKSTSPISRFEREEFRIAKRSMFYGLICFCIGWGIGESGLITNDYIFIAMTLSFILPGFCLMFIGVLKFFLSWAYDI